MTGSVDWTHTAADSFPRGADFGSCPVTTSRRPRAFPWLMIGSRTRRTSKVVTAQLSPFTACSMMTGPAIAAALSSSSAATSLNVR